MSTPYVGEIRMFGFPRVPTGWQACDGSLLSIAEYEMLYTLLGTTYGGDGQSTFRVPDLRGRVPMHWGTGQGLTTRVLGQLAGTENVTLVSTQLPPHGHPIVATTSTADATAVGPTVMLGAVASDTLYATDVSGLTGRGTSPSSTSPTGGGQPHDNTMPTLTTHFCIALYGVFPQQN
ncbi:phage tail protein [Ensifer adhaerens]|jgi:microcystin-dependent protein|uniref:Tail fiber protein n=2 Tax=Sinorhizobium/Ensifer group TaxID=227292 RepID=A0A9Q8YDI5_ENSAD|nr:tail fiber protein [Ensifer adhaerens]MBD9572509.1 phage tail protein [Ensifer sp. ENS08]OWZ90181.1 phage tail protein [Sinorhizobium sp. LM21]USJ25664.1 tail fiber protein [Ensifer adhaerens]UTV39361.1 tail fiber protein [Ensifer adhaerens]